MIASRLSLTLAFCATLLSGAFYFTKLNSPSIHNKDEYLHIAVTQEMFHSGHWWTPILDGTPYYHKPPLKMWLSAIPLYFFGESNFSYRFIDACCGVGTVLALLLLSLAISQTLAPGIIASILILGSHVLTFEHGFRAANQDAMLVCFGTFAMLFGYYALSKKNNRSCSLLISGMFIGLAALVKSIAALPILGILFVSYLIGKLLRCPEAPTLSFKHALLIGLPAFCLPLVYFGPHLFDPSFRDTMWQYEIVDRFAEGYHHSKDTLFYLKLIFDSNSLFPAEFSILAFLYWFFVGVLRRKFSILLLGIWAFLPLLAFSALSSRLAWYISPAVPGLALLSGVAMYKIGTWMLNSIRELVENGRVFQVKALKPVLAGIFIACAFVRAVTFDAHVFAHVLHPAERLEVDKLVERLVKHGPAPSSKNYMFIETQHWAKHERVYRRMLRAKVYKGLGKRKKIGVSTFVNSCDSCVIIVESSLAQAIASITRPSSWIELQPWGERKSPFKFLFFGKIPKLEELQPWDLEK